MASRKQKTNADGSWFDKAKAERAVQFVELLRHTDDFHGEQFELLPWERPIVSDVFGTMNARGIRQYRTVYLEIPKKNGKTELLSAIANLHLFNPDEPNGEIYGCAGDRKQASLIFDGALEMITQDPELESRVRVQESYKRIENVETGTTYQVISAEAFTKHGYRPSIVLFDELHVQPNRDLWTVMTKGAFLARRQPLLWVITTAGDDPDRVTIGWEIHEKAQSILAARAAGNPDGDVPTWYPVIYSYQGDDIYNEKNWAKANPSLGANLRVEDLRELAAEAKLSAVDEREFRWLHLNQWVTTKLSAWLPLDLWDQTNGNWDRSELLGRTCYLGLDLSSTTDLSSLCALFPPQQGQPDWRAIWDCWIPEGNMRERIRQDHVPYDEWAREGWIYPTPGDVVDYTKIEERILQTKKLYKVMELGADMSFASMLMQRLDQQGLMCVDVPQQYAHLTDPMNLVDTLLRSKIKLPPPEKTEEAIELPALTHEQNPVARWAFGNTSISKNGNAQIKYVKERKGKGLDRTKRIDPTTALVCAMARAKFYTSRPDLSKVLNEDWGM